MNDCEKVDGSCTSNQCYMPIVNWHPDDQLLYTKTHINDSQIFKRQI